MSAIFGGGRGTKKPAATGIQIQSSSNSVRVPLRYGQNKGAPNIIWYNDFRAKKIRQGGKGAGPVVGYSYSASVILALCEGPIADINDVWRNLYEKQIFSLFSTKYGAVEFLGTYSQTPWSYVTTRHPTEALPYRGIAYIGIPNYSLGDQPQVPQHNVEVNAILYETAVNGTLPDAEPAAMIEDFLTNDKYGTPFRAAAIDQDSLFSGPDATTTGDSAYETYCRAMGWGLSPNLTDPEAAGKIIDRWMLLTNSTTVWSGDKLKFIPYGDEEITANGVTFIPPTQVRYDLTLHDFIYADDEDPVQYTRGDPADAKNAFYVEVMDRANDYNLKPVPARDQASIETFGLKQADTVIAHEICSVQQGDTLAHLMLQRSAYVRNTWNFRLSQKFVRLEAMDVVTITLPLIEMDEYPVRIVSVTENDDGELEIEAEDFPAGVSTTAVYPAQAAQGTVYNAASAPGDIETPIIFEPPVTISGGVAQVWIGATGVGQFWGGCEVWFSTDDANFYKIGELTNDVRMGESTNGISAYAMPNPDASTLSVDLTISEGELDSADATDAANGLTLCLLGDELLSYEDATLTTQYNYDLDPLWRGLYGTTASAHLSGSRFMRLDDAVFKYNLDPAYIGSTVYFKFPSFNSWGEALQDLSAISSYSYAVSGDAYALAPPANLTGTGGDGGNTLDWDASPAGILTGYKIYAVNNHSGSFGMATVVGTVGAGTTTFFHGGLPANDDWRYWVTAYNDQDESTEIGPEDLTTGAGSGGAERFFGATGYANNLGVNNFATKGGLFTPAEDITVEAVYFLLDPSATGQNHQVTIATESGGTISTIVATSNVYQPNQTTPNLFRFEFASPVALTGGTRYLFAISNQSGTGTTPVRVGECQIGTQANVWVPNVRGEMLTTNSWFEYNTTSLSTSQAPNQTFSTRICFHLDGEYTP